MLEIKKDPEQMLEVFLINSLFLQAGYLYWPGNPKIFAGAT